MSQGAPNYTITPRSEVGQVTVANTNRDGTGTIVDIFTAGASGSRLTDVRVSAPGTSVACSVVLYQKRSGTYRYIGEVPVVAVTPGSTGAPAFNIVADLQGLPLPAGDGLSASVTQSTTLNVRFNGGDF